MPAPLITLTTDFGAGSPYVAQMKGVLLTRVPEAVLVDLSHTIGPQNILEGALLLADCTPHFPTGSIHLAVVDPGVGTSRHMVLAHLGGSWFLAPNNGLLGLVARRQPPSRVIALTDRRWWRAEGISATFHGRDLLAPVAAHLARGVEPGEFGPPLAELAPLDWPEPSLRNRDAPDAQFHGELVWIDPFGNAVTNFERESLAIQRFTPPLIVECAGRTLAWVTTYGDRPPGTFVALFGSSGRLEIAAVEGNAAETLNLHAGLPVVVRRGIAVH